LTLEHTSSLKNAISECFLTWICSCYLVACIHRKMDISFYFWVHALFHKPTLQDSFFST